MNFLKKCRRLLVYAGHWIVDGVLNFLKKPKPLFFYEPVNINPMIDSIQLVGHAGGEIDSNIYTNSREAVEKSIQMGRNVVELDFVKLDDNYVCFHDDEAMGFDLPESIAEFCEHKIKSKYTPLTLDDLLKLMEIYSSLVIITDCKDGDICDFLETICAKLQAIGKADWSKRFIIQVYSISQAKELDNHYSFFTKGLTLYASSYYVWDFPWLTKMCIMYHIPILIMPYNYVINNHVLKCLKSKNIKIWVHTVNDKLVAQQLKIKGVDGIYTDILCR